VAAGSARENATNARKLERIPPQIYQRPMRPRRNARWRSDMDH
jgi:hypothetical protein